MELKLRLPVWGPIKKNVGFRFSILAWYKLSELTGVDLDKTNEIDQLKMYKLLIYTTAWAYYVQSKGYIPKWLKPSMGEYWYNRMTMPQSEQFNTALAKAQSDGGDKGVSKKK